MRIYMQIQHKEQQTRYYQLLLQQDLIDGWTLVREWGNQGARGRVKRDHFPSHTEALTAMQRVRDAQVNRGFQIVFMQGADSANQQNIMDS